MKVELTSEQEKLKETIVKNLKIAKEWDKRSSEEIEAAFEKMKNAAHRLHMQLDPKPKHHQYMIDNRGVEPTNPEFYNHIHPVEDLLDYLEDTSANDDPEDVTLNDEFKMEIYSNRWQHYDTYTLRRVENGWHVEHLSYNGLDKLDDDMAFFTGSMVQDNISYPRDIDYYMNSLWIKARDEGLNYKQVQKYLDEIAEWISQTEKSAPKHLLL